ncbi:hypothetical protein SeLEV6574_g00866 [Synchytrium endobioticum]|uniref:HTH APSES-type domain-containing protein n=1 Tax=Synchytrium endobioticum TaxID=286115 RepID=A0A507DG25_9FUNG|nr:hypothetical protein SeLEV6574_g00866 [Synchytrium endobioticum]
MQSKHPSTAAHDAHMPSTSSPPHPSAAHAHAHAHAPHHHHQHHAPVSRAPAYDNGAYGNGAHDELDIQSTWELYVDALAAVPQPPSLEYYCTHAPASTEQHPGYPRSPPCDHHGPPDLYYSAPPSIHIHIPTDALAQMHSQLAPLCFLCGGSHTPGQHSIDPALLSGDAVDAILHDLLPDPDPDAGHATDDEDDEPHTPATHVGTASDPHSLHDAQNAPDAVIREDMYLRLIAWESEGAHVYQIDTYNGTDRVTLSRRVDSDYVNATKLLNAAGLSRGRRDATLKQEANRDVKKCGPVNLKGVWIPLLQARDMADEYIEEGDTRRRVSVILSVSPQNHLHPDHRARSIAQTRNPVTPSIITIPPTAMPLQAHQLYNYALTTPPLIPSSSSSSLPSSISHSSRVSPLRGLPHASPSAHANGIGLVNTDADHAELMVTTYEESDKFLTFDDDDDDDNDDDDDDNLAIIVGHHSGR